MQNLNHYSETQLELRPLFYEFATWKRSLEFMQEENIYMKYMLSEILRDNFDKALLAETEDFHNCLLREDDSIGLLRTEISETDRISSKEMLETGMISNQTSAMLKKIRNNIKNAEEVFIELKARFINYLSENYSPQ